MATDRRWQAHPASPIPGYPWPTPSRRQRAQYALAVFVQTTVFVAALGVVLAFAAIAAAAVGVDASAGITR